jgi:hypothetical protein
VKVVLHAGFPKTGSSSLQRYFGSHILGLSQSGIYYPKFDKFASHWALTAAFHDAPQNYHHVSRRITTEDVSHRLNAARKKLHSLLAAVEEDGVVLLSHEGFGADLLAEKGISELRDTLLSFTDRVQIVAYARNPVELYPSSIQQRLKSLERHVIMPGDWVSDHTARADYLKGIFGEEHCEILIHSSSTLTNGDIIDDFAQYLSRTTGKQLPLSLSRERRNTSLSGPTCAILFALKMGDAGALHRKAFARLRKQLSLFGAAHASPKLALPKEWIGIIAANHADAWNRLVDKTSYSPEQKATHRLPSVTDPWRLSSKEFRAWLLESGSREYTLAFADYCEAKRRNSVSDFAEGLRRLALHFPSTGPWEPQAEPDASPSQRSHDVDQLAVGGAFRESFALRRRWDKIRERVRTKVRSLSQRVLGPHYDTVKAVLYDRVKAALKLGP